jgi:DNA invertase Pin-like site-specific DNA recombinase
MTTSNSSFSALKPSLAARFGHGEAIGPCALAFTLDDDGDGVIYARAARADNARQLINQAECCIALAEREGRKPRRLLLSVCSGLAPLSESPGRQARNPGLQALFDDAASSWCSWVAYRCTDRLSRDAATAREIVSQLRASNVDLLVVDAYRFVGATQRPVMDVQAVDEAVAKAIHSVITGSEKARISERIKAGQKARRDRGNAK